MFFGLICACAVLVFVLSSFFFISGKERRGENLRRLFGNILWKLCLPKCSPAWKPVRTVHNKRREKFPLQASPPVTEKQGGGIRGMQHRESAQIFGSFFFKRALHGTACSSGSKKRGGPLKSPAVGLSIGRRRRRKRKRRRRRGGKRLRRAVRWQSFFIVPSALIIFFE